MRYRSKLIEGRLVRRYQRFLADVALEDGRQVTAHCPNPGSMLGLLPEGGRVLLSRQEGAGRKLPFTWEQVRVRRTWVGIHTGRANDVVAEGLAAGRIRELLPFDRMQREVPVGKHSRLDFLLQQGTKRCYIEVKSVTLAQGSAARFPDAPTERGRKHLQVLARLRRIGARAVLLYLVNRGDCSSVEPAADIDPRYARTLECALRQGVEVLAYRAAVGRRGIEIRDRIPFHLHPGLDQERMVASWWCT